MIRISSTWDYLGLSIDDFESFVLRSYIFVFLQVVMFVFVHSVHWYRVYYPINFISILLLARYITFFILSFPQILINIHCWLIILISAIQQEFLGLVVVADCCLEVYLGVVGQSEHRIRSIETTSRLLLKLLFYSCWLLPLLINKSKEIPLFT